MKTLIARILAWLSSQAFHEDTVAPVVPPPAPKPVDPPKPVEPPKPAPTAPKYNWTSKEAIRHSMRVIGDEMGLTPHQKDLLCDIARCESGFVLRAKLVNAPGSVDRGLFQWNSYWHKEITDAIAYDPEKATRLACQAVLHRKAMAYWKASSKCWNAGGKYNDII